MANPSPKDEQNAKQKSNRQWLRVGGFRNLKGFGLSRGWKMYNPEEFKEANDLPKALRHDELMDEHEYCSGTLDISCANMSKSCEGE